MGGREREDTRGRPRADKTTKQLQRTFTSRAVAAGHAAASCHLAYYPRVEPIPQGKLYHKARNSTIINGN